MSQTKWHDATELTIEGRGWADAPGPYDRLPERAKGVVPESVWDLSRHSAGLCVRFRTDAPAISVRWSLTNDMMAMPHMPSTGVSGIDLYRRETDGRWRFVQNGPPAGKDGNVMEAAVGPAPAPREYLLYLPLYNGVSKVEIGVPTGAQIEPGAPRPAAKARPIVIYGTSIVQGGCASRPGLAWTAIVGRQLDRPVVNLGFSGSGRMEPEVARFIAELDPAVFVIDCLWNVSGEKEALVESRVETLARTIRASQPKTPILFVGQSFTHVEQQPTPASRWQEKAVRALEAEHVTGLYVEPGDRLVGGGGEGTVDGVHPNDLGMMRQAECLVPALRRLLRSRQ